VLAVRGTDDEVVHEEEQLKALQAAKQSLAADERG
jgi:fermentation-respiration switch protein FrsA (DUF1100 family)